MSNTLLGKRAVRHALHPVRAIQITGSLFRGCLKTLLNTREKKRFQEVAQSIVVDLDRPIAPKGIAVFLDCGFKRDGAMYALIMRSLTEKGWHVASLHDDLEMHAVEDKTLSLLDASLKRVSSTEYVVKEDIRRDLKAIEWEIDLASGTCLADGIDYYPIVMGKLRRLHKAYDLDFTDDEISLSAEEVLKSAAAALAICYFLRDKVASTDLPVRIIGAEHLYVPTGMFMMFCAEEGYRHGVEFIDFGGAYSHYFTAGEYLEFQVYAVQNITRRNTISRHIIDRSTFDQWVNKGQDVDGALKEAQAVIQQNWVGTDERPDEARRLVEKIKHHRANGGAVACAFGHVGFDLSVPRDHGDAHKNMVDWLNDTITTLNDTDTLLLIKPHPSEKRYKPNRKPNQLLEELIHVPRAQNVIMLDALWFNAFDIFELIDVGLIWRSNVALELAILGIPAVVAGKEAAYRYALDLIYPSDRDNYHDLLEDIENLQMPEQQDQRCALYLKYITTETFINFAYVIPPELQESQGFRYAPSSLRWNRKNLERFLSNGDPAVDRVCTEIMSTPS